MSDKTIFKVEVNGVTFAISDYIKDRSRNNEIYQISHFEDPITVILEPNTFSEFGRTLRTSIWNIEKVNEIYE